MVFAGVYSGCQQRPCSTDGKGRWHRPLSLLQLRGAAPLGQSFFQCLERQRDHGSRQQSRGVTFPGSRSHSRRRGPHGPRGPGGSDRHASRSGDLDTCSRAGSRPNRAAATRDSPCGGRAAAPDPGSRWARAAEGGPDGSRPGPTAAGSGGPWRARPATRARAGTKPRRACGGPAASAAYRFSGSCAPPAQETRGGTRTHAPHAYVRPRPSVRTSTCPLGGRPRPRVGRGWSAQSSRARLEAGPREERGCGRGRDQGSSGGGVRGGRLRGRAGGGARGGA